MVDDCTECIDGTTSHFPVSIYVFKSVYLCRHVQLEFQVLMQIVSNFFDGTMHLALVPADKKDVIRKPQILYTIQASRKMIKFFEVKIEQPRADIVTECQSIFIS